ncbi:Os08g0290400, partial [Oryza sativa Japonica Group]
TKLWPLAPGARWPRRNPPTLRLCPPPPLPSATSGEGNRRAAAGVVGEGGSLQSPTIPPFPLRRRDLPDYYERRPGARARCRRGGRRASPPSRSRRSHPPPTRRCGTG